MLKIHTHRSSDSSLHSVSGDLYNVVDGVFRLVNEENDAMFHEAAQAKEYFLQQTRNMRIVWLSPLI